MSDCIKEMTCSFCGHTWYANVTALLRETWSIYKAGDTDMAEVSAPCPECGKRKVLTLSAEEAVRCRNSRS